MFDPDQRHWRPQHLDVGVTDLCSLNCRHCYLNITKGVPRGSMSRQVCDQVIQYTGRIAPYRGENKIAWNLFGGEPFEAFDVIEYLVTEAEVMQLPVAVEVFTNGATATDSQVKWCREHHVLPKRSSGGCEEMCALTRPGDYQARYDAQTPLWDDWGTMRRVTLVPGTEPYVMKTLKYFYDRGYWGGVDFVTDDYAHWSDEQIAVLKDQITKLGREFVRQFQAGHVMYNERIQITAQWLFQQPQRLNLSCGAGWGLQAITWEGYVMPCHRYLREPRNSPFCGGLLSELLAGRGPTFGDPFTSAIVSASRGEETETCRQCSARLPCQHGCHHLSWASSGDLKTTPRVRCEVYRHYVEVARWIHSQLKPLDPIWYLCTPEKCLPVQEVA